MFMTKIEEWFLLILMAINGVRSQENLVEPLSNAAHFVEEGRIVLANDRIDIVLDIDLAENKENAHDIVRFSRALTATIDEKQAEFLLPEFKERIHHLADSDLERWHRIETTLTNTDPDPEAAKDRNNKRFVFGVLLSALIGGVSGLLWGRHENHETLKKVAKEQGRIIEVLKESDVRMRTNTEHINLLRKIAQSERIRNRITQKTYQGLMTFTMAMEAQDRQLTKLEEMIVAVVMHQRVPPMMMAGTAMRERLENIAKITKNNGEEMATIKPAELAKCPVSHGTFTSLKWRVVIHVPTRQADSTYGVMRYVNLPFAVAGSSGRGQLELAEDFDRIAVCAKTSRMFVPRTTDEDGWLKLEGYSYYLNAMPTTKMASPQAGCLRSVMLGDKTEILRQCKISASAGTKAERMPANHWGVCSDTTQKWIIKCKGKTVFASTVTGCRKIKLQARMHIQRWRLGNQSNATSSRRGVADSLSAREVQRHGFQSGERHGEDRPPTYEMATRDDPPRRQGLESRESPRGRVMEPGLSWSQSGTGHRRGSRAHLRHRGAGDIVAYMQVANEDFIVRQPRRAMPGRGLEDPPEPRTLFEPFVSPFEETFDEPRRPRSPGTPTLADLVRREEQEIDWARAWAEETSSETAVEAFRRRRRPFQEPDESDGTASDRDFDPVGSGASDSSSEPGLVTVASSTDESRSAGSTASGPGDSTPDRSPVGGRGRLGSWSSGVSPPRAEHGEGAGASIEEIEGRLRNVQGDDSGQGDSGREEGECSESSYHSAEDGESF